MIECNAIIESNNEIDKLKRENNILKASNGEYEDALARLEEENEQLKQENNKIKTLLFQKIKELNDAYQKSAKAGMPTGGIIGELDSFEEICEKMKWV